MSVYLKRQTWSIYQLSAECILRDRADIKSFFFPYYFFFTTCNVDIFMKWAVFFFFSIQDALSETSLL